MRFIFRLPFYGLLLGLQFGSSWAQSDNRVDLSQLQDPSNNQAQTPTAKGGVAQSANTPFDSEIKGGTTTKADARKYSGIAVDVMTRQTYGAWNYQTGEAAGQTALDGCGTEHCVSYWFSFNYGALAIAPDNSVWGADSSNDLDKALASALANCNKYSAMDCEIAVVGYPDKPPIKYEWSAIATDGKNVGKSWYSSKKAEAEALAKQYCGSEKCWAFGFQTKFAAIATSSDKKMHGAGSNVSLKDAEAQSLKLCNSVTNKKCRIVTSGSNQQE